MEFDDLESVHMLDAANLKRDLEEGDKEGRKSTEEHLGNNKAHQTLIKQLEANAVRRGDAIVPPPSITGNSRNQEAHRSSIRLTTSQEKTVLRSERDWSESRIR